MRPQTVMLREPVEYKMLIGSGVRIADTPISRMVAVRCR